jgi:hypothetical protein
LINFILIYSSKPILTLRQAEPNPKLANKFSLLPVYKPTYLSAKNLPISPLDWISGFFMPGTVYLGTSVAFADIFRNFAPQK